MWAPDVLALEQYVTALEVEVEARIKEVEATYLVQKRLNAEVARLREELAHAQRQRFMEGNVEVSALQARVREVKEEYERRASRHRGEQANAVYRECARLLAEILEGEKRENH